MDEGVKKGTTEMRMRITMRTGLRNDDSRHDKTEEEA